MFSERILICNSLCSQPREKLDALEKKNTESKSADSSENLIRELTRALGNKGSLDQLDATGYIDANLIDKDDILSEDEIVRFYAHVSTYVIVDDLSTNSNQVRSSLEP